MEDVKKVPFIGKTWVIVLACIFLPPVGIAFLWMKKDMHLNIKIILTGVLAFYMLMLFAQSVSGGSTQKPVEVQAPAVVEETVAETPKGIMVPEFTTAVNEYINNINAQDTVIKLSVNDIYVSGTVGNVKIYLADLNSWSVSDDTSKKEFINVLGQNMSTLAASNVYDDSMIGMGTILYSPSGMQLGEYTAFGNVKLN